MAQILIPHGIQVNLFGHDKRGDELLHVFHVYASNALPTGVDCAAVCSTVNSWAASGTHDYVSLLPTTTFIDRVVATSIAANPGPYAELAIGQVGTNGAQPLPSEVSLALKKACSLSGRRHRGRFFVWPATVGDLDHDDSNLFDVAYVGRAVDTFNQLRSDLASTSKPLVVASYADGQLYDVTTIVAVDAFVDRQGRRGAGRGR